MVQGCGLCRKSRAKVVVCCDRVDELGPRLGVELLVGQLIDESYAELDVTEQFSFAGRGKARRTHELIRPPDVVQERGSDEQVGTKARV